MRNMIVRYIIIFMAIMIWPMEFVAHGVKCPGWKKRGNKTYVTSFHYCNGSNGPSCTSIHDITRACKKAHFVSTHCECQPPD